MIPRNCYSKSTEDSGHPKYGEDSVEVGCDSPQIEDAKASYTTEEDWFPPSQWPKSRSNSVNSTGGRSSCSSFVIHEPTPNLERLVTSSEAPREPRRKSLSGEHCSNAQDPAVRGTGFESIYGRSQDGNIASAPFSLKETGSPAGGPRQPHQNSSSPTNPNDAKMSLVCGPLPVEQTLTERQLDIEKRMLELRQQNRRRLHRRQQEAKEQQLQRIKEHRAALLARRERIKLASLWKERGMAAAARPSAISKGRAKVELLPSDESQHTENDTRSADELLAALVISESISLQTELGSNGNGANADVANMATYQHSASHCRHRAQGGRNAPRDLASVQPMVCASSNFTQDRPSPLKRSLNSVQQPTDEQKEATKGSCASEKSNKPKEQTYCTLPDKSFSCELRNGLVSSQRLHSSCGQFESMPCVPYCFTEAPYARERDQLYFVHRANEGAKRAAAEKAPSSIKQCGGHRFSTLIKRSEHEHERKFPCKIKPLVVVTDQNLKKQVDAQLQKHQQHVLEKKKDALRVVDTPDGLSSPSAPSLNRSATSCRVAAANSKVFEEPGAPEMINATHIPVTKATELANVCRPKEYTVPSVLPEESNCLHSTTRRVSEQNNGKNEVSFLCRTQRFASCMPDKAPVTNSETIRPSLSNTLEGPAKTQANPLQVVRVCRDVWCERRPSLHERLDTEARKTPCKAYQAHESPRNCLKKQKMSSCKEYRYMMQLSSSNGESDCSSAATKPQEDASDKSGEHATARDVESESKVHTSTATMNAELIEDEDSTISAVWALQRAEVEEEKRLLLLEMSQLAIEKQAEARRKEGNVQSHLFVQQLQTKYRNSPEPFTGCSWSHSKGPPCAEACSFVMHPVKEPVMPRTKHCTSSKPSDMGSCGNIPATFHAPLAVPKEAKLKNGGVVEHSIQGSKQSRWGLSFHASNVSPTKTPERKLCSSTPLMKPLEASRQAKITTNRDKKVQDNKQQQQLHSESLLKQQEALIGKLLERGLSAGHNGTKSTATTLLSGTCLYSRRCPQKHDTCLQVRATQRLTVLQALQHLLLFPSKASHRDTLGKGIGLEKKDTTSPQGSGEVEISRRSYQRQVSRE